MIGWLRRVRAKVKSGDTYRFGRYGTFWHRFSIQSWRLSVCAAVCKFEDRWCLHLGPLWIELGGVKNPPEDMMESWGFSFHSENRALYLTWGDKCKFLYYPWAREWVQTEQMASNGQWMVAEQAGRLPAWVVGKSRTRFHVQPDGSLARPPVKMSPGEHAAFHLRDVPGRLEETFDYKYVLRSGQVQERRATVAADRRTFCWRGFWKLGIWFPKTTSASIWVSFSEEVGEEAGSWKGGTVGCGYEMLPGETMEQCLRRMERDRRF